MEKIEKTFADNRDLTAEGAVSKLKTWQEAGHKKWIVKECMIYGRR